MRVVLLGTGTPRPDPTRAGSSCLVQVAGTTLMVDCGPGAVARSVAVGVAPTQVDVVLFTHHHFDHMLDYPFLVLARWDQGAGQIPDLQVCGPPPTERVTRLLFGPGGVFEDDIRARTLSPASLELYRSRGGVLPRERPRIVARDVDEGVVCSGPGWTVRAVPARHVEHLHSLAYRLDSDEGAVVFTGDTRPCAAVDRLARGADVMVHACSIELDRPLGLATPVEAGRAAEEAGVTTLVLVHLGARAGDPGRAEEIRRKVTGIFSGHVVIGMDGMEIFSPRLGIAQ